MKKTRRLLLFAWLMALTLLTLVGCEKPDYVTSISLKDYDPNTVIDLPEAGFDYGAYTLVVSYASGKTEELPLTEEMINPADLVKFYYPGEHEITITYAKKTCGFKLSVERAVFGELTFPENNVFTYDGQPHTVEVQGSLPGNAVVNYPAGNSFVNAGTYDVTAIVSCEGYVTVRLSTTVTIEKAKYDLSGVQFEAREFVYDGQAHKVEISGELPEGVSAPIYTIDGMTGASAIEVGDYTVRATFVNDNPNYEPIPGMETTLSIIPATHNVNGLDLVFKKEDGTVLEGDMTVYNGRSVMVDLNDYGKLPKNVTVAFTVCDEEGNVISNSNRNTNMINAGRYTVTLDFILSDSKNYYPIQSIVREFEVLRAEYPPLEHIQLVSGQVSYDGEEHSLCIEGTLPGEVTVSYEYYLDDVLVVDGDGNPAQAVCDAGRYTVKAILTHSAPNYREIPTLSATLRIAQATIDAETLEWAVNGNPFDGTTVVGGLVYDGEAKAMALSTPLPEGVTVAFTYYLDGKLVENADGTPATSVTGAGEYTVYAVFTVDTPNYTAVGMVTHTMVVERAGINIRDVEIEGEDKYVYNGSECHPVTKTETIPESVRVLQTLYRVDAKGDRTAVSTAIDSGNYVMVFTIVLEDENNYVLVGSNTLEWTFEILPQTIDVSGIDVDAMRFTYNGSDQRPALTNLPEHVLATLSVYSLGGTERLTETVNAGEYRLEVILSVDSTNYVLSSTAKLVVAYEILPQTIDVSGVTLEGSEFVYDRTQAQSPVLQNLPEYVKAATVFYALDGSEPLTETQNAGQYRCVVTLTAENGNYALSGETILSVEYVIQKKVINLNDWFYMYVEHDYYSTNGDFRDQIFFIGDDPLRNYVRWSDLDCVYEIIDNSLISSSQACYPGYYYIPYEIRVIDAGNVTLLYNGVDNTAHTVNHYFHVVKY